MRSDVVRWRALISFNALVPLLKRLVLRDTSIVASFRFVELTRLEGEASP